MVQSQTNAAHPEARAFASRTIVTLQRCRECTLVAIGLRTSGHLLLSVHGKSVALGVHGASLIAYIVPASTLKYLELSSTVQTYRRLGVHRVNDFVQHGALINRLLRRS
jgi:hypothetical protein